MSQTINATLRLAAALDQIAAEDGLTRHALIIEILTEATAREDGFSPDTVLGYTALTGGELDEIDCPECGQPLIDPHIGFLAGARRPFTFGPVCDLCATTRQAGGW